MLDCVNSELAQVKDVDLILYVRDSVENSGIKALYDTYDDTLNDTSTSRGQYKEEDKEEDKDKEKERESVREKTNQQEKKNFSAKIKDLLPVFSSIPNFNQINKNYWNAIRETRKTKDVAPSVIYKTMNLWTRYDPAIVEFALKQHLENHVGKKEEYTLGIMRNTTVEEINKLKNPIRGEPNEISRPNYEYTPPKDGDVELFK